MNPFAAASAFVFVAFLALPQAGATTVTLPPGAVRPIIPSIGDIPWAARTLPAPGSSTPAPATTPPPEDRCVEIVSEFPSAQTAQANTCCHSYLYPARDSLELEVEEAARSDDYDRLYFVCCMDDADASLTEDEKLACLCRVAPAMAMCQCQGPHQADFINGCLRSAFPEGTPVPQFTLDTDAAHYTLTLGRRTASLPVCACASPQPFTGTSACGGSPLALTAYDYPCLYPEQASALRVETVAEGYRVTARMSPENCTRYGGTPQEPEEGELILRGELQPCTLLRPQCPCSAPPSGAAPSGGAPSGSSPDTGGASGDVPPSGSTLPADNPLKEPAPPSLPEPGSMTDVEKKEGGCSLLR